MSLAQPNQTDSRPSPGLTLNLSSNNPFRNRAASPLHSPHDPSPPARPASRNPFLDNSTNTFQPPLRSPDKMSSSPDLTAPPRPALSGNAADLFDNLTLNDRPVNNTNTMRAPPPRSSTTDSLPPPYTSANSSRRENMPPRGPPQTHRPTRSQEDAMRARKNGSSSRSRPTGELDIFADPESPQKKTERRSRRNSESSIMHGRILDPEEEKKRQERKRRERRHRERDGKEGSRPRKPDRKLDVIDKLDVTSIYGMGLFHHDGPFDACNPHRNRTGSRRAPMNAFAKDSLNNVMGGSGPINKRPDHQTFLGNGTDEAFNDYSKGGFGNNGYEPYADQRPNPARQASNIESATQRIEPIHGEETLGLGTSTFLEGAPASKTAMQRRETEQTSPTEAGGLSRKKSLAQKIRGINNRPREYGPGRVISPGGVTSPADGPMRSPETSFYTPGGSKVETNPFFNEFTRGDDTKKGASITIKEPENKPGRARAPSSPGRGLGERLERRVTSDGSSGADQPPAKPSGSGFLSRVKSLKGGPRKTRPAPPPPTQVQDA